MSDRRHKNANWTLQAGDSLPLSQVQVAVLMDIRDELQKLNALLHCQNAQEIPEILRAIRRNTRKPNTPTGCAP